ncbi:hypothetical protein AC579_8944 [Pseudocercospora musae]|uniref:Uncharacterized protein n=1 Tax=Pseudocercospora musae TaxID=113226 RepID=A0A139HPN2_9PEZI|nr:hypothetical protein AC579_8944 [Pseudocercospora musae]
MGVSGSRRIFCSPARFNPRQQTSTRQQSRNCELARDINSLAQFLASEQIKDLQPEVPFRILEKRPTLAKIVLLVDGIGHYTILLYDAIDRHENFRGVASSIHGLPEPRVMELVLR